MLKITVSNLIKKLSIKDISKDYYRLKIVGPFGVIQNYFRKEINVIIKNNTICLNTEVFVKETKSLLQSYKTILKNAFNDVDFGFFVILEVRGVGTKVSYESRDGNLIFNLGLSHPVKYYLPKGIIAKVLDSRSTIFLLMGSDRNVVLSTAAKIRSLKKIDMYKGKGIFFFEEQILLKEGKGKNT